MFLFSFPRSAPALLRSLATLLLICCLLGGMEARAACTATYTNTGDTTLGELKIVAPTPPFTVFGAGVCGTLAAGLDTCTVSSTPAAGAAGNVEWTFRGTLLPGAAGTVTMDVLVQ